MTSFVKNNRYCLIKPYSIAFSTLPALPKPNRIAIATTGGG